jgi:hypothetical protein
MTKLMTFGSTEINQNKYYKWYNSIVEKAKRSTYVGVYTEKHHIIPRSLGGDDSKSNLVTVTAKEHFILHCLLTRFTVGQDKYKMIYSVHCMSVMKSEFRYVNSTAYENNKIKLSKLVSEHFKKLWSDENYKEKMKNRSYWFHTEEFKQWIKENTPLKNKETHKKTIANREAAGNNIWSRNNPMHDKDKAKLIVAKRSGNLHYLRKTRKYFYRHINTIEWIEIDNKSNLDDALKVLGFPRATFMKMISEGYKPKRGPMANIEVKRVIYENQEN